MIAPLPVNAETSALAKKLVWFEPPEQALAEPVRFLAYAFARALHEDMRVLRRYYTDDAFRYALKHAPPGIIDPRSWAYWHVMLDMLDGDDEVPPMPVRRFGPPDSHAW